MKQSFIRFSSCDAGSVSLEFAFSFMIFLILAVGVLVYAEMFVVAQQVNWAAGELARSVANGDEPLDRAALFSMARDKILGAFMFPSCASAELHDAAGTASITVTYTLENDKDQGCSIFPFATFLPHPTHLSTTFSFGVE